MIIAGKKESDERNLPPDIVTHGPARQCGKRDEANCDPIGSIGMLPNTLYDFDDAAVSKGIGKRHDSPPGAVTAPSRRQPVRQ